MRALTTCTRCGRGYLFPGPLHQCPLQPVGDSESDEDLDIIEDWERLVTILASLRRIVDAQAEDEGLWFAATTASEAYLQQELRKLHAAIEREGEESPRENPVAQETPPRDLPGASNPDESGDTQKEHRGESAVVDPQGEHIQPIEAAEHDDLGSLFGRNSSPFFYQIARREVEAQLLLARAEKFLRSGDTRTDEARHLILSLFILSRSFIEPGA